MVPILPPSANLANGKDKTMEQKQRDNKKLLLIPIVLLAILLLVYFSADINIYGVWCHVNHYQLTPKAAVLALGDSAVSEMGLTAETPDYVWQADESNAIACFVLSDGVVTERLYTNRGRYYATGWFIHFPYEPQNDAGELSYSEIRRIRPNGLYGDEIRFTLLRASELPSGCKAVLNFTANGETWALVTPD